MKSSNKSPRLFLLLFFVASCLYGCAGNSIAPSTPSKTYSTVADPDAPVLSAAELVAAMGVGINLGNSLDEPAGERWGAQYEQEHYFDDYKKAGFGHVRIPVTWGGRTSETAPYTIYPQWMERVEQTIDWALERGFIVVMNVHHERWLKRHKTDADKNQPHQPSQQDVERLRAIWRQIANQFKDKPQRLIFEMLNEPEDLSAELVDQLHVEILAIIRETNPTRAVVFAGTGWSPLETLLHAEIPKGSNLIGNFHSYDPWPFGGQCAQRWGSKEDKAALRAIYQRAAEWSAKNNIPVTVNEFGVAHYDFTQPNNVCHPKDRKKYLKAHVKYQKEFGIAGTVWDDDGSFRIYDRKSRTWDPVLKSLISD